MSVILLDKLRSGFGGALLDANLVDGTRDSSVQYVSSSGDNTNAGTSILESVTTVAQAQTNLSGQPTPQLITALEAFALAETITLQANQSLFLPLVTISGSIDSTSSQRTVIVESIQSSGTVLTVSPDSFVQVNNQVVGNVLVNTGTHQHTVVQIGRVQGDLTVNAAATGVIWFAAQVTGTVTIPSGVTVIGPGIFDGTGVKVAGAQLSSAPSGAAGGDLSGTFPNPTVAKLQTVDVSSTAPADQQVLTYNASGTTWVAANVAQNAPSGSFLQASPAGALQQASLVEEATVIRSSKSLQCPTTSLFVGPNVRIFDVGERPAVEDMSQSVTSLFTIQAYDNTGSTRPDFLDLSAVQLLSTQAGSAATQSATTHTFVINDPLAVPEAITANAIFQLDSVPAASEPIRIELFLGSDDTGSVLLDELFAPVIGSNTVDLPSPLTVRGNTDYFLRLSASTSFTVRGNVGPPFELFYQLNGQVVTRRPLATQDELGTTLLTNFHVTAPSRVDVGTTLTGNNYSATYDLVRVASLSVVRLVGIQTTPAGSEIVIVADASRVDGLNTQAWTFPSGADFGTSGNTFAIRVEGYTSNQTPGTDTPVVSAEQDIVAQATQRGDVLYFGTSTDDTPANVDVTTLSSQTRLDGAVTLPTWSGSEHVIFAYPDSAAAVTALNIGGINQLAAFTLTAGAITVNSVSYSTLVSINPLLGSVASGTVVTITR